MLRRQTANPLTRPTDARPRAVTACQHNVTNLLILCPGRIGASQDYLSFRAQPERQRRQPRNLLSLLIEAVLVTQGQPHPPPHYQSLVIPSAAGAPATATEESALSSSKESLSLRGNRRIPLRTYRSFVIPSAAGAPATATEESAVSSHLR